MIRFIRQISGILVGIVLGVALAVFVQQPRRQWAVLNVLLVLCGLGMLLVAAYLIGRAMLHRYQRKVDVSWMETLGTTLLQSTYDANARTRAARMLAEGREQMRNLVSLIVAFVGLSHALTSIILVLGSIVGVATLMTAYMQVERLDRQNELLVAQNQLADAERRIMLTSEITSILSLLESERQVIAGDTAIRERGRTFTPPPNVVARVVALSRTLRPYRYLDTERADQAGIAPEANSIRLVARALSPERGQLLLYLIESRTGMGPIISQGADFTSSDLRKVMILGADLSGPIAFHDSDFTGADLATTDLTGALLYNVDFTGANLQATTLSQARMDSAKLVRANLSLADLDGASLPDADLNEARFHDANLDSADLRGVRLPAAQNFKRARMQGTNLLDAQPPSAGWLEELRGLPEPPVGVDWNAWTIEPRDGSLRIRSRR